MSKIFDLLCLFIWIFQFGLGLHWIASGTPINPVLYIIAVLMCILHYVGELMR